MKINKILLLRVSYWAGAIADAFVFFQMIFPSILIDSMSLDIEVTKEFQFALLIGAPLMLAWTFLLIWADRKPVERRSIIPLTTFIIAWNLFVMVYFVSINFVTLEAFLPNIIMSSTLLALYIVAYLYTINIAK